MWSAALISATRSSEILMAAALSGECCSRGVKAPPIQARSTNGGGVFTRSRTTTAAPGCAAFHWSTKSAVSFREVENSWRGLTSIASRVGIWALLMSDCLAHYLGGADDLKKR